MGAFEQPSGPVRGNLNKNVPKIQMPRGWPRGEDVEASIWLVHKRAENEDQTLEIGSLSTDAFEPRTSTGRQGVLHPFHSKSQVVNAKMRDL